MRFAPQILDAQCREGLGKVLGMSVINWVISYKNVVITLERPGEKQGLTLRSAELLIQFAPRDCFSLGVERLFSAGRGFALLFKLRAPELGSVKHSAKSKCC